MRVDSYAILEVDDPFSDQVFTIIIAISNINYPN